jgi:very-short-patch-repair endonuclease
VTPLFSFSPCGRRWPSRLRRSDEGYGVSHLRFRMPVGFRIALRDPSSVIPNGTTPSPARGEGLRQNNNALEILMPHRKRESYSVAVAHGQRSRMTLSETALWNALRNRGLGVKFRRQVPIGRYIVDFLCAEKRLIVESDGPAHDNPSQKAHDKDRDLWLKSQGFNILRLPNDLVVGAPELAVQRIKSALKDISSQPILHPPEPLQP